MYIKLKYVNFKLSLYIYMCAHLEGELLMEKEI